MTPALGKSCDRCCDLSDGALLIARRAEAKPQVIGPLLRVWATGHVTPDWLNMSLAPMERELLVQLASWYPEVAPYSALDGDQFRYRHALHIRLWRLMRKTEPCGVQIERANGFGARLVVIGEVPYEGDPPPTRSIAQP